MMSSARTQHTAEQARDVRARAWSFIFDCYAKKKAAARAGDGEKQRAKGVRQCLAQTKYTINTIKNHY
jgi:hypothetical protein